MSVLSVEAIDNITEVIGAESGVLCGHLCLYNVALCEEVIQSNTNY